MPRIVVNTVLNPGTLFDFFNTNLEWNPHNFWGNAANIASTVICTGFRLYAEIIKEPLAVDENGNTVTKPYEGPTFSIKNPAFSTATAGITQLIVAGTNLGGGSFGAIALPAAFGVGDIVAAFNKEAKAETAQEAGTKKPNTVFGTIKDVLATAENYFAYGLSTGQGLVATGMFAAAAVLATARKVPFLSRQLNRLGQIGRQMNNPYTTFGLLALGCCVAALGSNLHVAASYIGFGVAYCVIPTFKSGGLYEAVQNRFRGRIAPEQHHI